jgi:hypothetical protein
MSLLALDPNDSGEIGLSDAIVDTYVLEDAEPTRSLSGYAKTRPPTQALRLANADPELSHATGELPLMATGAELAVAARTHETAVYGPFPKREWFYRGRRRLAEPLRPVPAWAWLLTGAGLMLLSQAGAGLAVLAVTR